MALPFRIPARRQPILGITPGLCFFGHPALQQHPAGAYSVEGPASTEGCWRLLRSQFPWLTSLGRCSPPGLSAVQTGQYRGMPAPYPVPFGSSASASCAGSRSRWLNHTFACAAHRCLLDGIPGCEASRVRRLSPLQTVEDQSQAWGIRCHSCTWREGFAPSWKTELQG